MTAPDTRPYNRDTTLDFSGDPEALLERGPELEALDPARERLGELVRLGRAEQELRLRRRLLEGLQERVEGRQRQHVDLVHDPHAEAAAGRLFQGHPGETEVAQGVVHGGAAGVAGNAYTGQAVAGSRGFSYNTNTGNGVAHTAQMDLRTYGIGAQILRGLGVTKMRVLGSPRRMPSMTGYGLEVTGFVTTHA